MKAFSFLSILKNFGKQLSSLASQMPWCNLRFNLGSMSVLSRVNPLFSRTSFGTSFGASFGTSRRASHFAAMIFAVLTLSVANIGMAWGETITMSSIFTGENTSATITSPLNATVSTTASAGNAADSKLSSDNFYFQIVLTDKTFSAASINGYINSTDKTKNWGFQFTTNGGTTWGSEVTQANDGTKSAHDINVGVTIPSGANGIRIIRKAGTSTYVYSVTLTTSGGGDTTPPTLSSSTPANGATDVAVSGNIVLTFSENVTINDASKFTLSGGAGTLNTASATASGTVVTIPYSGLANNTTYTLATAAEAVKDGSNNKNAALSNISFTTVAAAAPCPSSGTLYTAAVKGGVSSVSIPASSTHLFTSSEITITGGKLSAINPQESAKNMIDGSLFRTTNNNTIFKIELDCILEEGDVITIDGKGGTKNDNPIGLWVSSSDSRPSSAPACSGTSTTTSLVDDLVNYTVTSSDEYHGKSILYIHRAVGSSTYFNNINISRPADAPPCTAPTSPSITPSNGWLYVPGEEITLTASASNTDASTTYTWYRGATLEAAKAAGAIQAAKTAAQGGTTYTIASCTASDAYKYWCEISNGTGCEASASYDIKLYTFFLYNNDHSNNSSHAFTYIDRTNKKLSVTFDVSNATYTYYFKVSDGLGTWYGKNSSTITSATNYCDGLNSSGANVGLTTTLVGSYTVDYYYESNNVVVTYPVPNQTAGQTVYFDNTLTQMSNMYIRIGSTTQSSASSAFTAVPGTAALYQGSTIAWDGFAAWSIADNTGRTANNSIYQPWNGQWTGTGNNYQMSKQTDYQNYAVSGAVTIVPTALHSSEYNCQYYNVDKYNGLLTHNVSITPPSYGTLTVNYITISNEPAAFNSGNRDLAHTANYCVTAEEGDGYTVASITINGTPVENRSWHVLREDVVVAATFSPASYTVTLNTDGGTINAGNVTSYTYGTGATLPTNVTKSGFTFDGWYDNSGLTGSAVTTISTTATGNKEYWAKWTAAASLTALECNTLYTPADMLPSGKTISSSWQYDAYGLSGNTKFFIVGNGGDKSTAEADAGIVEIKTGSAVTISGTGYSNYCYFKMAPQMSGTTPTSKAIKFILSGSGSLDVYGKGVLALVKEGGSPTTKDCTSTPSKVTWDNLTAGTYYLYATGTSRYMLAMQFNCCTTPAEPTAFSAGSITSTGATFSITDGGDAASYDIYYSTSSTAPTKSTAATTTSDSKTKAVTGLTANTTYYAWVRSVCDASHKSDWVALGTTSFTTSSAEPTALVTWQMKVDQAAWALKSGTTEDGTNITSIASTADEPGSTSTGITGTTGKVVMASGESNVDKAASFTFTVNSAKKVVPEKVTCKVLNVSSGNRTYKAQLSDNNGHVYYSTNTVSVTTENVLTDATFNFASSLVLTGNVTLKVYAWKTSGSPTQFRMGEYVKLFGTVDDYNCTALNLTRGGQENGTYTVGNYTGNPLTCTVNAGEPASYQWKQYTLGQGVGEAVNAVGSGSTTTSFTPNPASANTYYYACEVTDICGNTLITPYTGTFVFNTAVTYSVTHTLTNVTATSGATGASAATEGVAYNAVFAASSGYVLPSTITVTIGGSPATVGTGYTWNASTGAFQVPAAQVTGDIVVTIAGETAPSTKDIYYGQVKITDGALVKEIPSGAVQFFTNIGGTVANTTEISLTSTPSTGGIYYNSNNLTDAELSKSSNWGTSSGSNRYIRGLKFASGTTYTLALGAKVASAITFYGWCGSASKTMNVDGEEYVSSATKNKFGTNTFTKSGGFTGNVSITQDGDFYGILVITIQTATPCTTPTLPTATLSNQSLCEGADIAAWDATVTNASTISTAGETVTYFWKKKGNATELANTASFDLGASAAESQAGTYVVTVTVSKAGYASATATKEVTLTVNEATEVTAITADKATVCPTNSVTLTATANMDATWQWYTCTNAEGDGEDIISGAESASYTIASAGSAGTYYYKVKATGDCGTAEMVYTLTVSAAAGGDCETEIWVVKAADLPEGATAATHITTPFTGGSNESASITIDGNTYTITQRSSNATGPATIVVPEGNTATLYILVKGNNGRSVILEKGGVQQWTETPEDGWQALSVDNLAAGTYSLRSSNNLGWGLLALKLCSASACTDPEVTASADNTTACVGTSVTFTATGAHAEATYQWQKLDGAWTDISGETASTYTIASVVAGDAGKYRVIASHDCNRMSNEVTLSVPSAPNFGSTVPASVSVMQTIALSINTVEATDAVKYRWYKSADATWDAGDTEIGTNKELIKAYDSEAIGSPSYYIFCRAQNACGITTSTAIAVNVTAYVEEDCATRGNEVDAEFGFQNSGCGQGTYNSASCWTMNSNSKILIYSAPDGKYFKTMKVTIASSSASKASYNWSTDGGSSFTEVAISSINTTLTEKTIDVSTHGNVNALQIGRNLDGKGESSGTLYVSKICFEYTDACTATTVTPSTSSVNYEMGGAWSNPTFTLSVAGTLSYSSSNEDIASVDDDGTVTFNGEAGTVTITASYAGNATYCASEGSYTINVSCPGGAPKIEADGSVNMSGCNSSVTLHAKKQDGTAFDDGTYQWFRNGEEIDGATSSSYTAKQAGTYTVARTNTSGCTTPSTNSAIVTSETTEPEVERLVPFQYYHVDKTYSDQMKMRHLFAVKNSGTLEGKHFKMYVSRNGGAATDVTSSNALVVVPNGDGHVDTVMVDLNKLSGKYSENDELVFTCKAIDCSSNISDVYKNTITMNVIGKTPTLALICSGSSKAGGTRKTSELTVGGDFLTGYNPADLCQQTGNTSFDANTEWGFYTELKTKYIVTPVNGYAEFNKLNYEPFDILLLTDYPKASKSEAAATILDDMAALCDYRPLLSLKAHMVAKSPSKWAAKGFTTSPVVPAATSQYANIVCYVHPMFEGIADINDQYTFHDDDDPNQLVYQVLTGPGYEGSKGIQGFELADADNFVTIGLIHYNAAAEVVTHTDGDDTHTHLKWTPAANNRQLVAIAERQANIEARMILFAINCGAQSKQTPMGRQVLLTCLDYLLKTDPIEVADCRLTFDNGEGAQGSNKWENGEKPQGYQGTGYQGDGLWSTAANWGPEYKVVPGRNNDVRIAAPCTVDANGVEVLSVHITEDGSLTIPADKSLTARSTILRADEKGNVYPTNVADISLGSNADGNASLILNNERGDTKAGVAMYSKAYTDKENTWNWQYVGTPHNDVNNALYNYYNSWLYSWNGSGWSEVPTGGAVEPWVGYCITHPEQGHTYWMEGTLAATTNQDITIPAGKYVVVANSWTAPIQINELTNDDMEGLTEKSIYFFNTGSDPEGDNSLTENATGKARWAPSTYISVPIHAADYTEKDANIPSMQGFYVVGGTTDGTLHLDYERHVRAPRTNTPSGPMHAPARIADTDNEPQVAKFLFRGTRYDDRLIILERPDFTRGYDSGWDGEQWGGNAAAPMSYVVAETRYDAVSAIPEYEGTVIGFRAGEDNIYTIHFDYDGMEEALYLLDTETKIYTRVLKGNSYTFACPDKAEHNRFILTRKAPQIATGTENIATGENAKAVKFIKDDKIFIFVNGILYDATGKMVVR